MIHGIFYGERLFLVVSIHAGTRSVDEVLHLLLFGELDDVMESDKIRLDIGEGVDQAVSHSCLRCQMQDLVDLVFVEDFLQFFEILQASLVEFEIREFLQDVPSRDFEIHIVIIVLVVESDNGLSLF